MYMGVGTLGNRYLTPLVSCIKDDNATRKSLIETNSYLRLTGRVSFVRYVGLVYTIKILN